MAHLRHGSIRALKHNGFPLRYGTGDSLRCSLEENRRPMAFRDPPPHDHLDSHRAPACLAKVDSPLLSTSIFAQKFVRLVTQLSIALLYRCWHPYSLLLRIRYPASAVIPWSWCFDSDVVFGSSQRCSERPLCKAQRVVFREG
jgi:hypothetical protein